MILGFPRQILTTLSSALLYVYVCFLPSVLKSSVAIRKDHHLSNRSYYHLRREREGSVPASQWQRLLRPSSVLHFRCRHPVAPPSSHPHIDFPNAHHLIQAWLGDRDRQTERERDTETVGGNNGSYVQQLQIARLWCLISAMGLDASVERVQPS